MSWSNRCEGCPGEPPPEESAVWRLERWGDAVVTWACDEHLVGVLRGLQRDHEATQVSVFLMDRLRAVNEERRAAELAEVETYANEGGS